MTTTDIADIDELIDEAWRATAANSQNNGGQHVAEVHIGHLLEQIAQAARQVGPAKHGALAYHVLSALVAGGVDRELVGCVLEEVG